MTIVNHSYRLIPLWNPWSISQLVADLEQGRFSEEIPFLLASQEDGAGTTQIGEHTAHFYHFKV